MLVGTCSDFVASALAAVTEDGAELDDALLDVLLVELLPQPAMMAVTASSPTRVSDWFTFLTSLPPLTQQDASGTYSPG
jgi:hypothetical protein